MEHWCNNCGEEFNEPKFEQHGHDMIAVCPYCGSEEWAVIDEEDGPNHPCS